MIESPPSSDGSDDLRRKVTGSIGWVIAERWSSRLLSLGVFAILTRLLEPEAFGLISLATAVIAILLVFVDSGFTKALIQTRVLGDRDTSTAFWTSVTMSIVLYVGIFSTAPVLASAFDSAQLTEILRAMGIALPIGALSQVPAALLERTFGFKVLSIRQLIAALSGAGVGVGVALSGGGVWALVAQTISTSVVSLVVLWAATSWRPRFDYSVDSFRKLWPTGVSVMGTELLDAVQGNIDKVVIGLFFSAEQLGYYFLAQRIGIIVIELVTTVISRVSLTTFSRVQDDRPRLNRIFRQMTFVAGSASIVIFALVALLAPQGIPVLFGPGWEPAIQFLWLLAPAWALSAAMYFDRGALLGTGHVKSAFWVAALQNVVGVVLVFALLPLGVVGVALSRWARIITWPVRLWVLKRAIGLNVGLYLLQIARAGTAVAPVALAVGLLQLTPWAQGEFAFITFAIPVAITGLLIYAGLLWLLAGEENKKVLRPFIQAMRNRFRRSPA